MICITVWFHNLIANQDTLDGAENLRKKIAPFRCACVPLSGEGGGGGRGGAKKKDVPSRNNDRAIMRSRCDRVTVIIEHVNSRAIAIGVFAGYKRDINREGREKRGRGAGGGRRCGSSENTMRAAICNFRRVRAAGGTAWTWTSHYARKKYTFTSGGSTWRGANDLLTHRTVHQAPPRLIVDPTKAVRHGLFNKQLYASPFFFPFWHFPPHLSRLNVNQRQETWLLKKFSRKGSTLIFFFLQ